MKLNTYFVSCSVSGRFVIAELMCRTLLAIHSRRQVDCTALCYYSCKSATRDEFCREEVVLLLPQSLENLEKCPLFTTVSENLEKSRENAENIQVRENSGNFLGFF